MNDEKPSIEGVAAKGCCGCALLIFGIILFVGMFGQSIFGR